MNEDKELEEAIKICELLCGKKNKKGKREYKTFARMQMEKNYSVDEISEAIEIVVQALKDSIPKKKIEEYLAEETEKYKVYKKEVDKNENLRGQLWHHMGAKNMCEKILGIEKIVTLY